MSTSIPTDEEAAVMVAELRDKHRNVLTTALLSEGTISSHQVGLMSHRRREQWQRDAMQRMAVEAEIRQLSRPYAVRLAEVERRLLDEARGRAMQSCALLRHWLNVAPGKRGMRPTVRKQIEIYRDRLQQELTTYPNLGTEFKEMLNRCIEALK